MMKTRSYSRPGRKFEITRSFEIDESSLDQSRDLAIKHIKDYTNLLEVYGPSERLAKYLIVSRPRPIINPQTGVFESQFKVVKEEINQLDKIKSFGQMLEIHPNIQAQDLDRPMVQHLKALSHIYPSLNQNKFLQANRQQMSQRYQSHEPQPPLSINQTYDSSIIEEDETKIKAKRMQSVPKITHKFMRQLGLISKQALPKLPHNIQYEKSDTSPSPIRQKAAHLSHIRHSQQRLHPQVVGKLNESQHQSELLLVKSIDRMVDESMMLTAECKALQNRLESSNRMEIKEMKPPRRLKTQFYDMSSVFLGVTKTYRKAPIETIKRIPFDLRMNRLYPLQLVNLKPHK